MKIQDYHAMGEAGYSISLPAAKARLYHEATGTYIDCNKTINVFQRLMLRWCFGLKYEKL